MAYTYPAMVAWDPNNKVVVKGVTFNVYATTDTGFTSPLPITDLFGNSLPYLNSGTMGVFPSFRQAQYTTVVVSDSAHTYAWTVPAALTYPVMSWAANTYYTVNQSVIDPNGNLVTCNVNHTSGATFTPANWNTPNATMIDGGSASSVYLTVQNINGGTANG